MPRGGLARQSSPASVKLKRPCLVARCLVRVMGREVNSRRENQTKLLTRGTRGKKRRNFGDAGVLLVTRAVLNLCLSVAF